MLARRANIRQHARMPHARKIACRLPALLWAGTIFFLSAQSALPKITPGVANFDKVGCESLRRKKTNH
jgi:hypothetical protein